ncbi:acyl carrier protein [Streptomyces xylophagus]|uniref:acyl carrier protein n=1 Tax=Streptomyces xylophagus TaxID=285514 RepID=UPI0005B9DBDE|nr:acyl carrier protein [Streptomyces xylophagus]
MTGPSTHDALIDLLRSHSPELRDGRAEPEPDDELIALGIDSLELLSLGADMEETFDIDIDNAALGSAKTVADLLVILEPVQRQGAE